MFWIATCQDSFVKPAPKGLFGATVQMGMMRHSVVLEFDPMTRHYTATVPGLPGIVIDAKSEKTALKWASDAIAMHLADAVAPLRAKVVVVNV